MNAEICRKRVWNEKRIYERCDVLSDRLIEIFPYPNVDACAFAFSNVKTEGSLKVGSLLSLKAKRMRSVLS